MGWKGYHISQNSMDRAFIISYISQKATHIPATKHPAVMVRMEVVRVREGGGRRKMRVAKTRLTRGVHRFTAPYIGIFMPEKESSIPLQCGYFCFTWHMNFITVLIILSYISEGIKLQLCDSIHITCDDNE